MRVAVLKTPDGFIISELSRHFRLRGHQLHNIEFNTRIEDGQEWVLYDYKKLLDEIFQFKPDIVFSLNHRGLNDKLGRVARLLALLKIPTFSWHLDSPLWNLNPILNTDNPFLTIFCFDRSYIEPVKARLKQTSVVYLPNATDPGLFRPLSKSKRDKYDLTFVGSLCFKTFTDLVQKNLGTDPSRVDQITTFLENALGGPWTPDELAAETQAFQSPDREPVQPDDMCRLADEYQAYTYRSHMIGAVSEMGLHVFGDEDWLQRVQPESFGGRAAYYKDLPRIYGSSKININLSRPQVRTGLNQRFFDVPAAEGLLLTDFREDIVELFDQEREIVVFKSEDDFRRQAEKLLMNTRLRKDIAHRARQKVLDRHTYGHRVDTMEEHFRERAQHLTSTDFFHLKRFWADDPGFIEACRLLGQYLFHKGDRSSGRFLYDQLVKMGHGDAEVGLRLGALLCSEGKLKESEVHIQDALTKEPLNPVVHSVAGVLAEKKGNARLAYSHFRRSIDLGNADPNVFQKAVSMRQALQVPITPDRTKPSVAFCLADANYPFGGVRVMLEYANRLALRGYPVYLLTQRAQYSDWYPLGVPVVLQDGWRKVLNTCQAVVFSQHQVRDMAPHSQRLRRVFLAQHVCIDDEDHARAQQTFEDKDVHIIAVSSFVQKGLLKRFGRESRVVLNGIDTELFHPMPEKKSPDAQTRILYCYSHHPIKGGEHGLDGLLRIQDAYPQVEIRLFSLGTRPKHELDFQYVRNPDQESLAQLYAESHIFLSTSEEEGFGLPALEAMACGCAVVSTRNGGNDDYAVHEENALLYDFGDVSALERSIARLIADDDLRSALGQAGVQTARRFEWKKSVEDLEEALFS